MDFNSSNHHVLENCKTQTLFDCRLVCHLWAEEINRILRKRGVTISFRSTEDIDEFLQISRPFSQNYTQKFLVDIPGPRSPSEVVDQVPTQVVDLLDCYQQDIIELKLWYQPQLCQNEISDDVEENIPVLFNKLTTLHLLSSYVNPGQSQVPPQKMPCYFLHFQTPNLRSLSIQHLHDTECSLTVVKILESSDQALEYLKIPAKSFSLLFKILKGTRRLMNLTELDLLGIFNGFSCSTEETLDAIIFNCPKLEKLSIEFSFRVGLGKILEMFRTLSNTLTEFRCTIQDRNLLHRQIARVEFIFPVEMVKLRVLQMRWSNPGLVYYIDKLPSLEELSLDSVWTRKVQGSVYPSGQPFVEGMNQYLKLTKLKLTEVLTEEQVDMFSKYFPNLQTLGCSFGSNNALRNVFVGMPGLKWLIIERKSNVTEAGGLLGVDENDPEAVKALDNGEVRRILPYLGTLKELETLELCQLGVSWWSILYGVLDLLKLTSLVIQSKALKPPAVDFIPNSGTLNDFIPYIAPNVKQLRDLSLWIRHTSERPSQDEINLIATEMSFLKSVRVMNHSLCGI